jgi:signal transduction histidine kinase/uncharacterized protein (DUF2164 family)
MHLQLKFANRLRHKMIKGIKISFSTNRTLIVYLLLALSFSMVIVNALITYYYSQALKEERQMADRRFRSIEASIQLLSDLKDMETGQRGYIITADSAFLEPYHLGKVNVEAETAMLNKLIDDSEPLTKLLREKIIAGIANKTNELEASIKLFNLAGQDSAGKYVGTKVGKAYMDTLRVLVHGMTQKQKALLSQMKQKAEGNAEVEDRVRFFGLSLIGFTLLASLIMLVKKQQNIDGLIGGLEKVNEELEVKVQDRTKELIAANQAKDHFLGMATHDLKSPIANVVGLIELMKLENKERSSSDTKYLNYMQNACAGMQQLISNLLDINRIEQGATTINIQEVSLMKLLTKLKSDFAPQAERKNITFLVDRIDWMIQTDPDALSRVLENLVSNAIKFSASGQRVRVRAGKTNHIIQFDIKDEGPGISSADMPKLFGKFQKLSNRPTAGESSTGLGLAIVKELTTILGGEISVSSEVGKGTVFTVTIPMDMVKDTLLLV